MSKKNGNASFANIERFFPVRPESQIIKPTPGVISDIHHQNKKYQT